MEQEILIKQGMFHDAGITSITNGVPKVKISIGNLSLQMFLLTGLEGTQPYRTQIDVALDETMYTIGAGKALGNQTFGLIDGPFVNCTNTDEGSPNVTEVLSKLTRMRTLQSRKIKITVQGNGHATRFEGVISNFNIKLDDQLVEGSYYILVSITAMGMWD